MKKKIEIVSLCEKKHLKVWKKATNYIPKYIEADCYTLVVPKDQINLFKQFTNKKYRVISEDNYISKKNLILLEKKFNKNKKRINWIKQNLIKLVFCIKSKHDYVLIWDSDTIPLKKINFFLGNKIKYYRSNEKNNSYYILNKKLLGYDHPNFSFITQCMITKVSWVKMLKNRIEKKFSKEWINSIIHLMNTSVNNPVSEYELIGVFNYYNFKNLIKACDDNWCRFGYSLIGDLKNLEKNLSMLSKNFDFLSFEKWERKSFLRKQLIYLNIFLKKIINFIK